MPNTDTEKKVSTHSVTIEDKNYTVAEVSQIIIDTLSHVSDQSRFNNLKYSAADVYWVLNSLLGYINNRMEGEFKLPIYKSEKGRTLVKPRAGKKEKADGELY